MSAGLQPKLCSAANAPFFESYPLWSVPDFLSRTSKSWLIALDPKICVLFSSLVNKYVYSFYTSLSLSLLLSYQLLNANKVNKKKHRSGRDQICKFSSRALTKHAADNKAALNARILDSLRNCGC